MTGARHLDAGRRNRDFARDNRGLGRRETIGWFFVEDRVDSELAVEGEEVAGGIWWVRDHGLAVSGAYAHREIFASAQTRRPRRSGRKPAGGQSTPDPVALHRKSAAHRDRPPK